jgi:adenylate kinase
LYNLLSRAPRFQGVCDEDGTSLIHREDDCESVIRQRLQAYDEQTGPVLDWFGQTRVKRVDGGLPPVEVSAQVERALLGAMVESPARVG